MKIIYTIDFFKKNFVCINKWYRENYRKLSPKNRRKYKNILEIVANLMVLDINTERRYPKSWRRDYNKNIVKALMDLEYLREEAINSCRQRGEK
jgi:hypothetical protein